MGQYHTIVNIDKNFFYKPSSLGDTLKVWEMAFSSASCVSLFLLLSDGWNGERIALVGDYSEDGDMGDYTKDELIDLHQGTNMRNVGWLARKVVTEATGVHFNRQEYTVRNLDGTKGKFRFYTRTDMDTTGLNDTVSLRVVNHTTKQMLNPVTFGHSDTFRGIIEKGHRSGVMSALFLLLAVSTKNGARGGGDFNHRLNGAWGGDRIGVVPVTETEGYTEIFTAEDIDNLR